jgi:hypothetical protein
MRPIVERHVTRLIRPFGLTVAVAVIAAACSGGALTPAPTAAPTSPPIPTPPPTPTVTKGPAAAQFTITGDPAVAGAITTATVQCNVPGVSGPSIVLFYQTSPQGSAIRVVITNTAVSLRYAAGAGTTYVDREFTGGGVSGFDAAQGATIDTTLATAPYAGATGSLGPINSIKGTVDCGTQTTGTSTMTMTGTTRDGALSSLTLNPVRVECDQSAAYGNSVQIEGIATVPATGPTFFIIDGRATGGFTVAQEPSTGVQFYVNNQATAVTLSPTGIHISGTATLEVPTTASPSTYSITVSGDAVCGSTVVS